MRSFTVKGTGITVHQQRKAPPKEAQPFRLRALLKWVLIIAAAIIIAHVFHGLADGSRGYHTPVGGGETLAALLAPILIYSFRKLLLGFRE